MFCESSIRRQSRAVFIYKIEDEFIQSIPPLPKKKRLKMATMKVTHVGLKIGELILKVAVDLALNNKVLEIYLTTFPKTDNHLVDLISEYGFQKEAIIKRVNGDEDVYVKNLYPKTSDISNLTPVEISRKYYPSYYDGKKVKKFLIPIRPQYHDQLFADYPLGRKIKMIDPNGESGVEGNTIKKAYLTHSKIAKVNPGDIILFYRSRDQQTITSVGVVDNFFFRVSNTEEILRLIGNRSVYSRDEIEELPKPLTIILFRHHFYLKHGAALVDLQIAKILNRAPQSIREIEDRQYLWIKQHGGLDENLTIH